MQAYTKYGQSQGWTVRMVEDRVDVDGLTWVPVQSAEEALLLLARGAGQRATAATLMNDRSSRSHAIFTLRIRRIAVRRPSDTPSNGVPKQACK